MSEPRVIEGGENQLVPIYSWATEIEDEALKQLQQVASLPFVKHRVVAMPDIHAGKGSTIGSVIATQGAIIPATIGVDIGCGVLAARFDIPINTLTPERLSTLRHSIERSVPTGFHEHAQPMEEVVNEEVLGLSSLWKHFGELRIQSSLKEKAQKQIGTLGGGNHFIEICGDQQGKLWILLHSGSRHVGLVTANYFIKQAQEARKGESLIHPDLAYLTEADEMFQVYLSAVNWCQHYAMYNREMIFRLVQKDLRYLLGNQTIAPDYYINCHHNFVVNEIHDGEMLWVTRKGAVRAEAGEDLVIPGSMGASSYVCQGKGLDLAFRSSPHGAGRRMSRKKAKSLFTQADIEQQTAGIECRKDMGILDELPGAYKDVEVVMSQSETLVSTHFILKQVLCIKG